MRMGMKLAVGAVLAAAMAFAPGALAGPNEDYGAVRADWQTDFVITPCRFTLSQLENARQIAQATPGDTYTDFPAAIDKEVTRWRTGGCAVVPITQLPLGTRLSLSVYPSTVYVNIRRNYYFRVTAVLNGRRVAISGATIAFIRRRPVTNRFGRAVVVARFTRPGLKPATTSRRGLRGSIVRIRVRPRPVRR